MISMAKATLLGHIGQDAEMKCTPGGDPVTNFNVAVSDGKDFTTWFKVVCWNKLAEIANERGSKGTPVFVEGRLKLTEWQGRDGDKRLTPEVTAQTLVFLNEHRAQSRQSISALGTETAADGDSGDL